MASEREQFTQFRDTDGNGLMDLEEVKVLMTTSTIIFVVGWKRTDATQSSFLLQLLPFHCRPGSFHLTLTIVKLRLR